MRLPDLTQELKVALRSILFSYRFWLAGAGLASINVTKGAIEHLGAVYFRDIAPTLVSDGRAAQLAAVWPFGMFCSVYVAGGAFSTLPAPRQVLMVNVLNGISVVGLGGLALLSREEVQKPAFSLLRSSVSLFVPSLSW
jgi:hypothetical protein